MFSAKWRSIFVFLVYCFSFHPPLSAQEIDAAAKKSALPIPKHAAELDLIRVSLFENVPEVTLAAFSPFQISDTKGRLLWKGDKIVATRIRAQATGIRFGPRLFDQTPIVIETNNRSIRVDNHVYRHRLKIWRENNGRLSVVNEIPLDDYLKGVVPRELPPHWPAEALKALTVAARTFAVFRTIERQNEKAHLGKESQLYGGKKAEHALTDQAVDATRGEILTSRGKIFSAYFHAACGGRTTGVNQVWNNIEGIAPLKGVACDFCRTSKHWRWNAGYTVQEIRDQLKKGGYRFPGISGIKPVNLDKTGRARRIEIDYPQGKIRVLSEDFRLWMGYNRIKSTWITAVDRQGDSFVFRGNGWGHGVGLCVWGAKELATLGYTYRQILQYYYPETEIVRLNPSAASNEQGSPSKLQKVAHFFEDLIE